MAMKKYLLIIILGFYTNFGFTINDERYPLEPKTSNDSLFSECFAKVFGSLYLEIGDSITFYKASLIDYSQNSDKIFKDVYFQLIIGKREELAGNYFKAIEAYLTILINYETSLDPEWQHLINNYVAISLGEIGAIEMSMNFNNKALKYTKLFKNNYGDWYYVYENHALTLIKAGKYEEAIEYFEFNLKTAIKHLDFGKTLHAFNNIGYCYQLDSNEIMATQVYLKGVKYYEESNGTDSIQISLIYSGLASSYIAQNSLDSAKFYLDKAIVFSQQLPKTSSIVQGVQYNFFNYFIKIDEPNLALNRIGVLENSNYSPVNLSLIKTIYYSYVGNWVEYDKQFVIYRRLLKNDHKKIKESLTKVNGYYLELQEKQILTLNKNIELNELLKRFELRRTYIFYGVLLGVILVLIVLFVVSRKRFIKEKELMKTKNLLIASELKNTNDNLAHQKKELDTYINSIIEKNDLILKFGKEEGINLPKKILTEEDWLKFKNYIDQIEPNLILKINKSHPDLSKGELRLFLLIRIKLNTLSISSVLGISKESVQKSRTRLRKKLAVSAPDSLENLIYSI